MMMMIMTGLIFVFYLSTTGYELSRLFLSLSLADFIFLSSQLVSLYTHARYALDEKEPGGSRYARIRVCVCVCARLFTTHHAHHHRPSSCFLACILAFFSFQFK